MATGPIRATLLDVEPLEDRDLLAAQITATFAGGILRIEGTPRNDLIRIRQVHGRISVDGQQIQVNSHQKVNQVAASAVKKIDVLGLQGDDRIEALATGGQHVRVPMVVWGGSGNDVLIGGDGNDLLQGNAGNDRLEGRGGDDRLYGNEGNDRLLGGAGKDILSGGPGNDVLLGESGNDRLYGNEGNDVLNGGTGNDYLDSGTGKNRLTGGTGNDYLLSRNRGDLISDGPGQDIVRGSYPKALPRASAFQNEMQTMVQLTSQYRQANGLGAVTRNSKLNAAAQALADYMAQTGIYSHFSAGGQDVAGRAEKAGYSFWWLGENIHRYNPANGRTTGIDRTYSRQELAQYYIDGWKVSPEHNANLLDPRATQVGVGIAQAANGMIYAVEILGWPR